jgi:hypothetical protein
MESTNFDDLKEEIKGCKTIEEINRMVYVINALNVLVKRRKKKILLDNPPEKEPKPISRASIDHIAKFLNEEIFPRTEREIKRSVLYERYTKWNKKDPNNTRKTYSKNKFYRILKLGKRVQFKHTITGDYFVFELDNKTNPEI